MWSVRRPGAATLDAVLARVAGQPLSYGEAGLSRAATAPAGYGREEHRVDLGAIDFAAARAALAELATHRLPYMFVHPNDARVREGADLVVCARVGPLWTANPCRIVYVEDTPDRFAYAYGTLPGHSEHGEELFAVTRQPDGRVTAETIALARPQDLLARLGKPIAHRVQRRIKVDYMQALARELATVTAR